MDTDSPLDEPVHICTELGEDDPDPFMYRTITLVLSDLIFYMQFSTRVSVSPQCGQIGAGD
jgi:hypothetical protein